MPTSSDAPAGTASLNLSNRNAASVAADVLVVAVARTAGAPRLLGDALPPALHRRLSASLAPLGVTGGADEVLRVPSDGALKAPVVVLTGVGSLAKGQNPDPEALRRAAGAATRSLIGLASAAIALPVDTDAALAAVAEGALLGAYSFNRYRGKAGEAPKQALRSVTVLSDSARQRSAQALARRAQVIAAAVNATRDLINTPPSDLFPQAMADAAQAAAKGLPVKVTVLDEKKLARGGYGGLIGVGQGSSRPPRLVQLEYAPARATRHVALVGKGITFDTGGISLKPPAGMEAMKSDMSGAAAVLSTVIAAARLELPVRVSGWLAVAENMPSGTAQRPSDVITIRGGKTVEVLNTDAEGRLVLADALVDASATDPDLIVDVATLTGAQMVALGNRVSAVMSNDDDLRERIHELAADTGEQFWPMPLPAELRSSMDSSIADIANIGDRFGGMLVAGLFLAEFVGVRGGASKPVPKTAASKTAASKADAEPAEDTRIPWAHLDIAGPAFNTGTAHGYTPVGGTGVSVRTMLRLIEDVATG